MARTKINYMALNEGLKPINKNTVKAIERHSSKYIFVDKNSNAKCDCGHSFVLANSKHKSKAICPKCKKSLEVCHLWRRSITDYHYWEVVTQAISNRVLVQRYYLVTRRNADIVTSSECARMFINADVKATFEVEYDISDNCWKKSTRRYFREYFMGWQQNLMCCLGATVHKSLFSESKKIDELKYYNLESAMQKNDYACSIGWHIRRSGLYEKLQKVGLEELIHADMRTYCDSDMIQYDSKQTELTKMLGITKQNLEMFKAHTRSLTNLRRLQKDNNISLSDFSDLDNFSSYEESEIKRIVGKIGSTLHKVCKYIKLQGIGVNEYHNYLWNLEREGYSLKDHSYSMPKDFHKEVARLNKIAEERREREKEERKKLEELKKTKFANIKHEIETNKTLKEFFDGSKKYMCYIPGSVEDFVEEGKNNHNCVGGNYYTDAVAKDETFIFFIREADNPSASFVTVEYCQGIITQIMFNKNERVGHDTEVYSFAEAFTKRLSAIKKVA